MKLLSRRKAAKSPAASAQTVEQTPAKINEQSGNVASSISKLRLQYQELQHRDQQLRIHYADHMKTIQNWLTKQDLLLRDLENVGVPDKPRVHKQQQIQKEKAAELGSGLCDSGPGPDPVQSGSVTPKMYGHHPGTIQFEGSRSAAVLFADMSGEDLADEEDTKQAELKCSCGNVFVEDAVYCRKCGRSRAEDDARKSAISKFGLTHQNMRWMHSHRTLGVLPDVSMRKRARLVYDNGVQWLDGKRGPLQSLVQHQAFEAMSIAVIMVSTAFSAWEVQLSSTDPDEADEKKTLFIVVQWICSALFIMEVLMRLFVYQRSFFTVRESRSWNYFDLFCMVVAIIEIPIWIANRESGSTIGGGSQSLLRFVRITRLMRLLRTVRFCRELREMFDSICGSVRPLFWLGVSLFFLLFFFALCLMTGVAPYTWDEDVTDEKTKELLKGSFGNILRSMLTLLEAISSGNSWGTFIDPLGKASPMSVALFLIYIVFAVFGFTNCVTSVFVDNVMRVCYKDKEAAMDRATKEKKETQAGLRVFFEMADIYQTGKLTREELQTTLSDPEAKNYLLALGIDIDEERRLFELMDIDGDGEVSLKEFTQICPNLSGNAKSLDVLEVKRDLAKMLRRMERLGEYVDKHFHQVEESMVSQASNLSRHGTPNLPVGANSETLDAQKIRSGVKEGPSKPPGSGQGGWPKKKKAARQSLKGSQVKAAPPQHPEGDDGAGV